MHFPFITLAMLISFASVNAVLFTPALPDIAQYFHITNATAQYTVSWFLVGYALGQLLYGPLTSRYGKKTALIIGIGLQITASVCCVLSGLLQSYPLLILSRFILALGSGVGLKMTFTLINAYYPPAVASQKISYLMLAFAITPGLAIALGGILNHYYGWMSCFMACGVYGIFLLICVLRFPAMPQLLDKNALHLSHLIRSYHTLFMHKPLIAGGLLMGSATSFVYLFAALSPFIAMNTMGMHSEQYGFANILPSLGLVVGSLSTSYLIRKYALINLIKVGMALCSFGVVSMGISAYLSLGAYAVLFLPMTIIYIGLSFIMANASTLAMSHVHDKAHGSAVMNFVNMGLATICVLSLGWFNTQTMLLPIAFFILCMGMVFIVPHAKAS